MLTYMAFFPSGDEISYVSGTIIIDGILSVILTCGGAIWNSELCMIHISKGNVSNSSNVTILRKHKKYETVKERNEGR